ncbi:MAG: Crp/Fnr family transcriptional regulator [Planctomycetota bacterium]
MTISEALHQYLDAADVNEQTLQEVEKITHVREYNAGDIVFREDEASDHLYIVIAGQVDVQYLLPSGKRQTFDTCNPGDFLCWSAVVRPHKTSSIGICRAKSAVIAMSGSGLRELSERDPHFGYHLQGQMARVIRRRLQAARKQIADLD